MRQHIPAARPGRFRPSRQSLRAGVAALFLALPGCAGDGTGPEPPPPPPPPPPPVGDVEVRIDLGVGDVLVITDPDSLAAFELPGAAAAREYRVALQAASGQAGASMPARFAGLDKSALGSVGDGLRGSYGFSASVTPSLQQAFESEQEAFRQRQRSWIETVRLQEQAWGELRRLGARVARAGAGAARPSAALNAAARVAGVPSAGAELQFILPIDEDLSLSCGNDSTFIQATVRSVGEHFVIARDMQGTDAYSASDYAEIQAVLDDVIHPVDTDYFGETGDLDGNERVIVLITEEVNKLSDKSGSLIFLGFFLPTDLSEPADCPASNAAEVVYLRAPDPDGVFGSKTTVERAIQILKSTTSHEFQHLINAEQRFVLGNDQFASSEEIWLNEGLSHLAEELVGLKVMGHHLRSNLGIAAAVANKDAFNTYLLDNFFNFGATAQGEDGCDGWMVDPENSVSLVLIDPPGCGSLTMRAWSYMFLRWLGDQFGPAGSGVIPGSNEALLFREIARGGPTHLSGRANIEAAMATFGGGARWEELMADFLLMPALDDVTGVGLPARTQLLTWNLRDLYEGLHQNTGTGPAFPQSYPLKVQTVLFDDVEVDFSVRTSSAKYFTLLATASAPDYEIRITDQAGLPLATTRRPQISIVRLR